MKQTQLFPDERIALLVESENGYKIINEDEVYLEGISLPIRLLSNGKQFYNDRTEFEKEIKKGFRVNKVKWV